MRRYPTQPVPFPQAGRRGDDANAHVLGLDQDVGQSFIAREQEEDVHLRHPEPDRAGAIGEQDTIGDAKILRQLDRAGQEPTATDHHDAAITQGIISMAHHLRLTVVAEGVEMESQVDFLKRSRCDVLQGYYFAKPMPHTEIEAFLSQPASHP